MGADRGGGGLTIVGLLLTAVIDRRDRVAGRVARGWIALSGVKPMEI